MTGRILDNAGVIEIRQGDSFNLKVRFRRDCKQINLSGAEVKMYVCTQDGNKVFTLNAEPIDVSQGSFVFLITPEHSNIAAGEYPVTICLHTSGGAVHTIFPREINRQGIFRITQQIAR